MDFKINGMDPTVRGMGQVTPQKTKKKEKTGVEYKDSVQFSSSPLDKEEKAVQESPAPVVQEKTSKSRSKKMATPTDEKNIARSSSEANPVTISTIEENQPVMESKPVKAHSGVSGESDKPKNDKSFVPGPGAKLVDVKSTVNNLTKLARSVKLKENVLLEGPTGAGKTAMVKYLAHLTQSNLRRINMSDMTDITEIIGGYKPVPPEKIAEGNNITKGEDGKEYITGDDGKKYEFSRERGGIMWVDGIIVDAMKKGHWLLLDEMNLADPAILERLNSLLDDDRSLVLTEKNNEVVQAHPKFQVFATMNPASYAGRKQLSAAMLNRLHKIWIEGMKPEEMVEVLRDKANLPDETLLQMSMFHQTIADMAEHRQIGKKDGPYPFTLRDTLKWIKRVNTAREKHPDMDVNKIIWKEARNIYEDRFINPADRAVIEDTLKITLGEASRPDTEGKKYITVEDKVVHIGDVDLPVNPNGGQFVPGVKSKLVDVDSTSGVLERMGKCVQQGEAVLMVGPTAAGKTAMVKYLAHLTNNDLRRYNLSMQTDTTEFIGGYKPTGVPGEYQWKDGILVDAMRKGHWVVLDEINLAEPAILERINSLLDGDNALVLTEKDSEVVKSHPDFRIFATMNPASYAGRKELSLAMRNRFTEMWTPGVEDPKEQIEIVKTFVRKVEGSEENNLAEKMVNFQNDLAGKIKNREIAEKQRDNFVYTLRNIGRLAEFIKVFSPEDGLEQSFINGCDHIYGSEMRDEKDRDAIIQLAQQYWNGTAQPQQPTPTTP